MTNTELKIPETNENFEALLNEQFGDKGITGSVVKGTIIRLTPDFAIVDVGLKSEGRIPLREFGQNAELKVGDKVEQGETLYRLHSVNSTDFAFANSVVDGYTGYEISGRSVY